MLVPKSSKCTPSFHKFALEILTLDIKQNPFNTHCSLKLSFTCHIRHANAMLFLGKTDDIMNSFKPLLHCGSSTFSFLCPLPIASFCYWFSDALLATASFSCCLSLVWIFLISTDPLSSMISPTFCTLLFNPFFPVESFLLFRSVFSVV